MFCALRCRSPCSELDFELSGCRDEDPLSTVQHFASFCKAQTLETSCKLFQTSTEVLPFYTGSCGSTLKLSPSYSARREAKTINGDEYRFGTSPAFLGSDMLLAPRIAGRNDSKLLLVTPISAWRFFRSYSIMRIAHPLDGGSIFFQTSDRMQFSFFFPFSFFRAFSRTWRLFWGVGRSQTFQSLSLSSPYFS